MANSKQPVAKHQRRLNNMRSRLEELQSRREELSLEINRLEACCKFRESQIARATEMGLTSFDPDWLRKPATNE